MRPADPSTPREDAPDWARWRDRWPNAGASSFLEAGGLRWHVQRAGAGPVVFLVHGTAGATHAWRDVLPVLAEHYTVVAPDLPGHGFTGAAPDAALTLPGMARALAAVLDALGVRPRFVVGHSAGAAVLLRMALDGTLPDARLLVGVNAALEAPPAIARTFLGGAARLLFTSPRLAALVSRVARPAGITEGLLRSTGSRLDAGMIACYEALLESPAHVRAALTMMAQWDVGPMLRDAHALRLPSLLLAGDDDRWVQPSQTARVLGDLPGAQLERIPGEGHVMHEAHGQLIAARLLRAFAER
jgi:magnesium chelatase accessory protein